MKQKTENKEEVVLEIKEKCSNLNDFICLCDYLNDGGYSFKIIKCPKGWREKVA